MPIGSVQALGLESIPLNDNSGDAWVSMNIYHHLHCLVSTPLRAILPASGSAFIPEGGMYTLTKQQDSIRHQIAGVNCKKPDPSKVGEDYFPPHIGKLARLV